MKSHREIDLSQIKVKPVYDYFDRADISSVLSRFHPLGDKKEIGNRISYTASYRGEWVAVLVFDKAVDRNARREHRIGWTSSQVVHMRKHIANNSRFLVAPEWAGVPNLASKVLSLATNRISDDWKKQYGIPLLAVETYVDPLHNNNQGTCYEAAGWENLGYSTGYQNPGGERTHSKYYFLKPLHKDSFAALRSEVPHALVTGIKEVSGKSNDSYVLDASQIHLKSLQADLAQITDPRHARGKQYPFLPFLSLCITAVLTGFTQYRQIADWIRKIPLEDRVRFGMPERCPHERTVANILSAIDSKELSTVLSQWLLKTYPNNKKVATYCLDGKALRATSKDLATQTCFLNVYACELGIVVNQIPTKKGAGELAAAQKALAEDSDNLLGGSMVLADAMLTDQAFIASLEKKTPRMSSLSKTIIQAYESK
jgi:hypothetical protein